MSLPQLPAGPQGRRSLLLALLVAESSSEGSEAEQESKRTRARCSRDNASSSLPRTSSEPSTGTNLRQEQTR